MSYIQDVDARQHSNIPPHDIEAEQALLSSILNRPENINVCAGLVEPEHFYEPLHGRIYDAIRRLSDKGQAVSLVTLAPPFENDPPVGRLTVKQYLGRIMAGVTGVNAEYARSYAVLVRDFADRRELIAIGETLIGSVRDKASPAADLTSKAIEGLTRIVAPSRGRNTASTIGAASSALVERLRNKVKPDVIPTGLIDLDTALGGGLRPGELILCGGRPSMGKSTLAPQIGLNVAKAGGGVAFYSLEMNTDVVTARCLSSLVWNQTNPITYADILSGKVPDGELYRLEEAAAEIKALPLIVDDQAGLSVSEIAARSRLHAAKLARQDQKLRLIIVDLIGKVAASKLYAGQRVYEIGEITLGLIALAKELKVPVLALHQVSRKTEGRDNKYPELADLRESGNLEQDADVVIFLYRAAYYLERSKFDDKKEDAERLAAISACKNEMKLLIAKQRNGPCKTIDLFASMENNAIRNFGK